MTQKVREGGRTVNVHALIATGVNAGGHREILGLDVTSSEDGAGWLAFLRGLAARGLSVSSWSPATPTPADRCDRLGAARRQLAAVPGALRRNLATKVPKSAQPWVPALVRTISGQPAAKPATPRRPMRPA